MDPRVYGLGILMDGFSTAIGQYRADQYQLNLTITSLREQLQAKDDEINALKAAQDGHPTV